MTVILRKPALWQDTVRGVKARGNNNTREVPLIFCNMGEFLIKQSAFLVLLFIFVIPSRTKPFFHTFLVTF